MASKKVFFLIVWIQRSIILSICPLILITNVNLFYFLGWLFTEIHCSYKKRQSIQRLIWQNCNKWTFYLGNLNILDTLKTFCLSNKGKFFPTLKVLIRHWLVHLSTNCFCKLFWVLKIWAIRPWARHVLFLAYSIWLPCIMHYVQQTWFFNVLFSKFKESR